MINIVKQFWLNATIFLKGSITMAVVIWIIISATWTTILFMTAMTSHKDMMDRIARSEEIYLKIIKEQKIKAQSDREFFIGVVKNIYKRFVIGESITEADKIAHTKNQKRWLNAMLGEIK